MPPVVEAPNARRRRRGRFLPFCGLAAALAAAWLSVGGCSGNEKTDEKSPATATEKSPAVSGTGDRKTEPADVAGGKSHPEAPPVRKIPFTPRPAVRGGALNAATKAGELFQGFAAPAAIQIHATVESGETWTLDNPGARITLPDLPDVHSVPLFQLTVDSRPCYIPFGRLRSVKYLGRGSKNEPVRCTAVTIDGREFTGTTSQSIAGRNELGTVTIAPDKTRSLRVVVRGAVATKPLAVAAAGTLKTSDEASLPFTSWAPLAGDVAGDTLLAESGTGPALVRLPAAGELEVVGRDRKVFFWNDFIRLTPAAGGNPTAHYVGVQSVLLEHKGVLTLLPFGRVQSLRWTK